MDKYIKRLQTRASRKGISVSKSQVREVYTQVVVTPESPTDEEILSVIDQLEKQYQAPSHEVGGDELTIPQPQITEITPESNPEICETLQPPIEQPTPQQEPQQMTPAQPTAQPSNSTLATSSHSGISQASSASTNISQVEMTQAIAQAVQQVGASNNAEAVELLTSLANELSADIGDVQEMVATLVTAYLNKRQTILSSAVNTLNTLRTAQTHAFQDGLDGNFFDQKRRNKEAFLSSVSGVFS
jgi:hypothetical protein